MPHLVSLTTKSMPHIVIYTTYTTPEVLLCQKKEIANIETIIFYYQYEITENTLDNYFVKFLQYLLLSISLLLQVTKELYSTIIQQNNR